MAGSSAYEFARASYRDGLVPRRRLARGAWANVRFRLKGSTDELRERIAQASEGVHARDVQRLGPSVLAGVLPRIYPQMLQVAREHQDAGREVFICAAAAHELAEGLALGRRLAVAGSHAAAAALGGLGSLAHARRKPVPPPHRIPPRRLPRRAR
jgi:phosphoserine phosphatase